MGGGISAYAGQSAMSTTQDARNTSAAGQYCDFSCIFVETLPLSGLVHAGSVVCADGAREVW